MRGMSCDICSSRVVVFVVVVAFVVRWHVPWKGQRATARVGGMHCLLRVVLSMHAKVDGEQSSSCADLNNGDDALEAWGGDANL